MEDIEDLATALSSAMARGEIFAVFQPQVALDTGNVVAVEGLCRWRHPDLGLIAPDRFIPLAERTGVIHELGAFMVEECLGAVDFWHDSGQSVEVSVNVSPVQLADASFAERLAESLADRALPPNALTVEITESLPVTDLLKIVPRLVGLQSLGLGVALDDFGTGHASFDQLDRLPITELKIDRSLIHGDQSDAAEVLAGIMAVAQARGLRVVAEGIETAAHLALARSLGCDRAQGFLLGVPMVRSDVDRLIAA